MAQVSIPLIQGANSSNPVGDAFDSRTAHLEQERAQKQKQQDDAFHRVVKYAADGLINEAKYYAQQKGLQVPQSIFENADAARGIALSKDLYDDPNEALKFTTAYLSAPGNQIEKYRAGLIASPAKSRTERDLLKIEKELSLKQRYGGSENKGYTLSAGQSHFENGQLVAAVPSAQDDPRVKAHEEGMKAVNAYRSGGFGVTDEAAKKVYDDTVKQALSIYGGGQFQNPYAGSGNPAINQSYANIPPVLMDSSGNMSTPQQGQGRLTPPQSTQIEQQTKTNIPQDYKIIGKTHDGFDLYQSPDGRQFYDDGKPEVQYGSVQTTNTVNDELSSPAMVEYSPQQQIPRSPVMKLTPVSSQNDVLSPVEYASVPQRGSMVDYAKTGLYNATNIPAHLYGIGRVSAGLLSGAESIGQGAMQGVDNLMDGVGDYINRPSQVIVYDKQGNGFYVPVEHLQKAINMGYSTSIDDGPKVPISQ